MRNPAATFLLCAAFLPVHGQTPGSPGIPELADYRRMKPGYRFSFPRDHGPHYGFRTEWWYYTGLLRSGSRRFGYQFTIFKLEPRPVLRPEPGNASPLYMAHLALTDEQGNRYLHAEAIQRDFPGLAGFDPGHASNRGGPYDSKGPEHSGRGMELYVEGNSLRIADDRHDLRMETPGFRLRIRLRTTRGPILQGKNGVSRKGPGARSLSGYYSVPDLAGSADLQVGSEGFNGLTAGGWMDHEFMTGALSQKQTGWDWIHFRLDNGERFMLFRVRSADGSHFYAGSRLDEKGDLHPIERGDLQFTPTGVWRSPGTGISYPVRLEIRIGRRRFEIRPWLDGQEFVSKAIRMAYWEGAVDVVEQDAPPDPGHSGMTGRSLPGRDTKKGMDASRRGRGYLELTGYGGRMGGML